METNKNNLNFFLFSFLCLFLENAEIENEVVWENYGAYEIERDRERETVASIQGERIVFLILFIITIKRCLLRRQPCTSSVTVANLNEGMTLLHRRLYNTQTASYGCRLH